MRNPFYHRQAVVDPRCFYGRGEVVRELLEMVGSGESCAIVGERRIGKSSLLAYVADPKVQSTHGLDTERTLVAELDFLVLYACSPRELQIEILRSLALAARDEEVQRLLEGTAELGELTFTDFRRALEKLKSRGCRVVLLCDEFELAVQNPQLDERYFGALRGLAQGAGVVFVTTSRLSLGELEQYCGDDARRKVLGSPFFNIFSEFSIGPFEDFEVVAMLTGSLADTPIRFEHEDTDLLDQIAGRHPYFLQLAAYHLYAELKRAGLGQSAATPGQKRLAKCRQSVSEEVGREAARFFRNQWKHSCDAERRTVVALAGVAGGHRLLARTTLDQRKLPRLRQRGLVRKEGNDSSPRWRLFSVLFADWIRDNVRPDEPGQATNGTQVAGGAAAPALTEESPAPERYDLLDEIGAGATGTVFRSWDKRLKRPLAIKLLHRELRGMPERHAELLREAQICAGLGHPHIVEIYDVEHGFLFEEFLAGGSLRDLLEREPVLPAEAVVVLAEQLADALGAAHRAGVVHRDLKPENVLFTARPLVRSSSGATWSLPPVKLADFGAAVRLEDHCERPSLAGTLAYMPPEQLAGEETGPEGDFYSLGVLLFEARHGRRPPPPGERPAGFGANPSSPLDAIIYRCLAAKPRERFASAEAFLTALRLVQS